MKRNQKKREEGAERILGCYLFSFEPVLTEVIMESELVSLFQLYACSKTIRSNILQITDTFPISFVSINNEASFRALFNKYYHRLVDESDYVKRKAALQSPLLTKIKKAVKTLFIDMRHIVSFNGNNILLPSWFIYILDQSTFSSLLYIDLRVEERMHMNILTPSFIVNRKITVYYTKNTLTHPTKRYYPDITYHAQSFFIIHSNLKSLSFYHPD